MLSSELCKKLKEAGFQPGNTLPQTYYSPDEIVYFLGHATVNVFGQYAMINEYSVYVPTLSELIEACPELDGISKQSDGRWFVGCDNSVDDGNGNRIECIRPTLEEAIAEIYLELHK